MKPQNAKKVIKNKKILFDSNIFKKDILFKIKNSLNWININKIRKNCIISLTIGLRLRLKSSKKPGIEIIIDDKDIIRKISYLNS